MIQVVFSFFFCDSHYKECWLSTISAFTTVILSFLSNVLWIYFPFLFLLFCSQENRFMLSSASPSQLSVPTSGTTAVALSASKCKYRYRFWMDLFGCMRCLVHYSFPFSSKFIFPSFKHTISTLGWRSQLVDMLQPQDVKKVCGFLVSVSAEAGKRLSGITYAASIKSYKLISQPENECVITSRLIDIYL